MKNAERIESTRQRALGGFRRYSVIIVMLAMILSFAMPVSAAGDPLTVINNLSTFIFGIIRAVGMILIGWGIV